RGDEAVSLGADAGGDEPLLALLVLDRPALAVGAERRELDEDVFGLGDELLENVARLDPVAGADVVLGRLDLLLAVVVLGQADGVGELAVVDAAVCGNVGRRSADRWHGDLDRPAD